MIIDIAKYSDLVSETNWLYKIYKGGLLYCPRLDKPPYIEEKYYKKDGKLKTNRNFYFELNNWSCTDKNTKSAKYIALFLEQDE